MHTHNCIIDEISNKVTKRIDISTLQEVKDLLELLKVDSEITLVDSNTPIAKLASINHARIPEDGRVPDMHPDIWVSNDFDDQVPERYWNNRTL